MLTHAQKHAYDFIARRIDETGAAPTFQEIALHQGGRGYRSKASWLVDQLVLRGYVRRVGCPMRGLALVDRPIPSATGRWQYFRFDNKSKQLVEWHPR